MNANRLHRCSRFVLGFAFSAALCLTVTGCSVINKFFSSLNEPEPSTSPSLLSEIPKPKQTSYSYSAIKNENIRNLYAQLESETEKLSPEEIQCTGELTQKDIYEAITAFKNDHPDVFWIGSSFSYYSYNGVTYLEITYTCTDSELSEKKQKFSNAIDSFMSNAPMYSSEYERERYINDYIVSNCIYDEQAAESDTQTGNISNAYGVLVDGKALCEGYARAFQLLCNKMGIDCVCVAGMTEDTGHEWNCAYIEGSWYQVDVTWNDSDDVSKYYYFNLTDEQMYESRTADSLFADIDADRYDDDTSLLGNLFVPECTATEYNYYQQTSPVLYGFDSENDSTISSALADCARNGGSYFSIIVDSSLDFDEAYSELVDNGYIVNYIESANLNLWGETELSCTSYAYKNETLRIVTAELIYNTD